MTTRCGRSKERGKERKKVVGETAAMDRRMGNGKSRRSICGGSSIRCRCDDRFFFFKGQGKE